MSGDVELISNYRATNYFASWEYQLSATSIRIRTASCFVAEREAEIPLHQLKPDFNRIRYVRQSCFQTGMLACMLGGVIYVLLFSFGLSATSGPVMTTSFVLGLASVWTVLHVRFLTAYRFYTLSDRLAFTVMAQGRRRHECKQFVNEVGSQIRKMLLAPMEGTPLGRAQTQERDRHNIIAEYKWSGIFDYGQCRLYQSVISVSSGRRLRYESEVWVQLGELFAEYSRIRYRRPTFTWTGLLMVPLIFFWLAAALGGQPGPAFHLAMSLLCGSGIVVAVTQFPLVTAYQFRHRSGAHAFAVFALGGRRQECEPFVHQVVDQIKTSEPSMHWE